jgi:hypothetical protein
MRVAITLGLVLLLPAMASAGFLSMEEGARATAMGGAFVGVADDATAVFWNPAGHGLSHGWKLTGMRTRLFSVSELSEDCIALTYGTWNRIGAGFGWTRTGLEDVYNEDTFVFGAGRTFLSERLALGSALRIYRISAPGYEYYNDPNFHENDSGYALDLGLLYKAPKWSIGCVYKNLGEPELQLIETTEETDPIHSEFRLGATYIFREVMLISAELRRPTDVPDYYDSKVSFHLGTEIWFFNAFALRAGMHRDRATAGLGLRIEPLTIDAAILTERRPGNKYRLSLSLDY